jgi:hypothetical protein
MLGIVNIGHPEGLARMTALHVRAVGGVVDREMGRPYGRLDAMTGGVATVAKGACERTANAAADGGVQSMSCRPPPFTTP